MAVAGDATKPRGRRARGASGAANTWAPVTLLVNNAGVPGPYGPIGVVDPDEWWAAQAVHHSRAVLVHERGAAGMNERRAGRIINISSPRCHMLTPESFGLLPRQDRAESATRNLWPTK